MTNTRQDIPFPVPRSLVAAFVVCLSNLKTFEEAQLVNEQWTLEQSSGQNKIYLDHQVGEGFVTSQQ